MPKTFLPFSQTDHSEWIKQLHKELQNQSDLLIFKDPIEGLEIDLTQEPNLVGVPARSNSEWKHFFHLDVQQENVANERILTALMQGATGLLLKSAKDALDWHKVLENVEVAYIDCRIILSSPEELKTFEQTQLLAKKPHISFLFDKGINVNYFSAFDIEQIGANISTQLAYLLLSLHRALENNALQNNYFFELGLGTQYFSELSKLRAFRHLISRLEAVHQVKINYELIVKTGWTNKSLKDPYTNLLRQATEALSAIAGGCDALCIQAYDDLSTEGSDDFSRRMALNIGNLIQEEALMKRNNDPFKNARVVEALTTAIAEQTWEALMTADDFTDNIAFVPIIEKTRQQRLQQIQSGQQLLIGITQYQNTFETRVKTWGKMPSTLGLPYFIFELI
ncbi:MAG: methylmalonyl-CoA mutase family protein [Flavobacteriales bacterium]